jgi:hypothetical protein
MSVQSPIKIPISSVGDLRIEHHGDIHKLVSKTDGVWMTDLPIEVQQMKDSVEAVNAQGKGLVGGLGLGVVAEFLGEKAEVTSVDIVEASQDVVDLVLQHLPHKDKINVYVNDIMRFLRALSEWPYQFAILDTWISQSAETWLVKVLPMRRIIANKFGKQNVYCWVEEEMKIELLQILTTRSPYWILSELPMPMAKEDALWFMDNVGLPEWEEKYGKKITI